ncbi:MAG: WD40 repeat domain-containing protein [Dolichospermum sp.]
MNKILEIEKVKFTIEGHSDSVDAIALTPDGKTVIAGSGDGTIKVWDLETGEIEFTLEGHSSWVTEIAITPDGKTVISGSWDNTIKIWDLETRKEKFTFKGHSGWVKAIAVTPSRINSTSPVFKSQILIVLLSPEPEISVLPSGVTERAVNRDGQTVISGSDDNTIKIWNLETGRKKFTFKGHSHYDL